MHDIENFISTEQIGLRGRIRINWSVDELSYEDELNNLDELNKL